MFKNYKYIVKNRTSALYWLKSIVSSRAMDLPFIDLWLVFTSLTMDAYHSFLPVFLWKVVVVSSCLSDLVVVFFTAGVTLILDWLTWHHRWRRRVFAVTVGADTQFIEWQLVATQLIHFSTHPVVVVVKTKVIISFSRIIWRLFNLYENVGDNLTRQCKGHKFMCYVFVTMSHSLCNECKKRPTEEWHCCTSIFMMVNTR